MVRGNRYNTIRWNFVESLEPPRVVQIRCPDMVNKGNLYGQVTVRMHTRQVRSLICVLSHSQPSFDVSMTGFMVLPTDLGYL